MTFGFSICTLFGQTESPTHKKAADLFEKSYNENNFNTIFNLFSPEMKAALPLDKTTEFLKGLQSQAGKIEKKEFIKYQKQIYALYKTKFTNALFGLNVSVDANAMINGLFIAPYKEETAIKPERNTTLLQLPFKEVWAVTWGGDTKEQNYHVESKAQKNAFDFVIKDDKGKTFKTDGKTNDDYYAFGKPLFAPCDGEVVLAVDGIKDNIPGELNPIYVPGNTVIIKTSNSEYLFFAHFKQQSIKVKQGQKVKQGDLLGLCGNSGNSSEPHLHFHIQNVEDMNNATGIKCYFDKLNVNGTVKADYSPVKGDIVVRLK